MAKQSKFFILLTALVLTLPVSCNKSGTSGAETDGDVPAPVLFASSMQANLITKARGALDSWTGEESIYVYGIRRDASGNLLFPADLADPYNQDDANAFLIDNVSAPSPASGSDGSIYVYRIPATQEYFFYRELTYYNFYAYYVGDAATYGYNADGSVNWDVKQTLPAPRVNKDSGEILLPVEISGKDDIMLAVTDVYADIAAATGSGAVASKAYGAHSARRGVIPKLIFHHQLARFNFYIKAGNQETADNVTLDGLAVGTVTKGELVLAPNDLASVQEGPIVTGTAATVKLQHKKADNSYEDFTAALGVKPSYSAAADYAGEKFGEPLLVMPGASVYPVSLYLRQGNYSIGGGSFQIDMEIDFSKLSVSADEDKDDVAVPGHQYDVTITVFGLQQVDIKVSLTAWKESGSFSLNPDAEE